MTDQPALFADLPEQPAPPEGPDAAELARHLRRAPMRSSTEAALQESIGEALDRAGLLFEREARLGPADRPDFLVGRVVIEAKTRGAPRGIYRQLERYAAHAAVDALILVSGTAMGLPAAINGKPLYVVSTGRAAL